MGRGGCGSGGRDPLTIYRSIFHPTPLLLNSPHNTPVIGEGNKKTKQYEETFKVFNLKRKIVVLKQPSWLSVSPREDLIRSRRLP